MPLDENEIKKMMIQHEVDIKYLKQKDELQNGCINKYEEQCAHLEREFADRMGELKTELFKFELSTQKWLTGLVGTTSAAIIIGILNIFVHVH